jgi:SEC-C motif domain protein
MEKREEICACGSGRTYEKCCEIIHQNIHKANTAEELMRSRYTAFSKANVEYLKLSHYSKTSDYHDKKELTEWCKSVKWLNLEIISKTLGSKNDFTGKIHFKAFFLENGLKKCIEEHSTFLKENNHWVYNTYE